MYTFKQKVFMVIGLIIVLAILFVPIPITQWRDYVLRISDGNFVIVLLFVFTPFILSTVIYVTILRIWDNKHNKPLIDDPKNKES